MPPNSHRPSRLEQVLLNPHSTARDIANLQGTVLSDDFDARATKQSMLKAAQNTLAELAALTKGGARDTQDRLIKATGSPQDVGTQQQGLAFTSDSNSNSELAPLIPQSFDGELKRLTDNLAEELVGWNALYKQPVTSMVREAVVETAANNRPLQAGFISEGGTGYNSRGNYSRRVVTVRMEAQRGEISDVGMLVRAATPTGFADKGAYETVRQARLITLSKIRERNIWSGSNGANSQSYDGFEAAIAGQAFTAGRVSYGAGSGRTANFDGALISAKALAAYCNQKATPTQGVSSRIKKIYVHPRAWLQLQIEGQANTRYDGSMADQNRAVRFFGGKVQIMGCFYAPMGVEVVPTPYISHGDYQRNPNSTATGDTIGTFTAAGTAAANAASLFNANDAGDYIYRITAIGENGESAPVETSAVTVAAGDEVTIACTETNGGTINYYSVERSEKNGAVGTTQWIGDFPKNTVGGAGVTHIIDDNLTRPYTSPVVFLTEDKGDYQWEQLLPAYVKPLAITGTTLPFLVLDFGSLFMICPEKLFVLRNVGFVQ